MKQAQLARVVEDVKLKAAKRFVAALIDLFEPGNVERNSVMRGVPR